MASPASFNATGSVAEFTPARIALSNFAEVNNEVVYQERSYIVFGFGHIRIACGSTKYDRRRGG
jgi:hypothetical protein